MRFNSEINSTPSFTQVLDEKMYPNKCEVSNLYNISLPPSWRFVILNTLLSKIIIHFRIVTNHMKKIVTDKLIVAHLPKQVPIYTETESSLSG